MQYHDAMNSGIHPCGSESDMLTTCRLRLRKPFLTIHCLLLSVDVFCHSNQKKILATFSNSCQDVEIRGCTFAQLGGNALALSGKVHNSVIADCDFLKTGDSGIVSVGTLPDRTPNDGSDSDMVPTHPTAHPLLQTRNACPLPRHPRWHS